MIALDIPGVGAFEIEHLVCDVNGTLAVDGQLMPGVIEAFDNLRQKLQVHLITADTHGRQQFIDEQLNLKAVRLQKGSEAEQKAAFVRQLGADRVAAVGQGANDAAMLAAAAVGIAVMSPEGLSTASLRSADLVAPDILTALALFQNPKRLVATLRK